MTALRTTSLALEAAPPASPASASAEEFGRLVGPYRRELLVHCYRMLGSVDDAEDAVQDALTRAWNGRETYRRSVSLRAWLYRIATNACLDAIDRRKRGGGAVGHPLGPFPEGDPADDAAARPEARYDAREAISIAFATVLQVLPPRQRAVLILRDVLSWHATEVAELLDLSVPAVNSALHRARSTMAHTYRPIRGTVAVGRAATRSMASPAAQVSGHGAGALRQLLERYLRAWEAADIPGLVALLRDDAVLAMPPALTIPGRTAIAAFFGESIFVVGREIRLVPVRANGGPGFAGYSRQDGVGPWAAFTILVLTLCPTTAASGDEAIARIDAFRDPRLFDAFGLSRELVA